MFWTFLTTFVVLAVFMLVLGLGMMLGRRKRECSCKMAARIMAAKTQPQRSAPTNDSLLQVLNKDSSGCQCGDDPLPPSPAQLTQDAIDSVDDD